jgi:predicted GNAT family acetyltransferase
MVKNNQQASQLEVLEDGQLAKLEYKIKNGFLYLIHTEVPKALGGQGIASKLALAGLEYGRTENMPIKVYCPYIARYLQKHPEQMKRVEGVYVDPM